MPQTPYDGLFIAADALDAQPAHCKEAKREVQRRECEIDAEGRPAVFFGEALEARRKGSVFRGFCGVG